MTTHRVLLAAALASLSAMGCSDDSVGAAPAGDGALPPPAAGQGVQLTMEATIEAGQEIEYCQYLVIDEDVDVGMFEHRYSPGSHHLLLYLTTLAAEDVVDDAERFDCSGRGDLALGGIAYAAQVPEGTTDFPAGVAMRFRRGQVVLMQTHYLNATDAALDADVRLNLRASSVPVEQEAGTLFFYDYSIVVPPHGKAKAKMRCELGADIEVSFAMSHMHRRGVGYSSRISGKGLEQPLALYETDRWEGVEPLVLDPPLSARAGQVVEFECDYDNQTADTIIEGPSASKNEMCMFVATYWPRLELADELCMRPGSGPVHDGARSCAETVACVQGTDDEVAQEQCQVQTCAGSSPALGDLNQCIFFHCAEVCPNGDACAGCVAESCTPQYLACQSASC
jgi:hypothetical protein